MTKPNKKICKHEKQNLTFTCRGSWNECLNCGKTLPPDIYKAEEIPINKDWEEVTMYKVSYALINKGDGNRCAWCNKLEAEIKDIKDHIEAHDFTEKTIKQELREKMNKWWEEEGYWSCSANEAVEEVLKKLDDILKLL